MRRLIGYGACFALMLTLTTACGGGGGPNEAAPEAKETAGSARPSGNGACGLVMQGEVDELFGTRVGAGVDEVLDGGVEICSWPSGDEPSLLLQISAASPDIHAAVDLGEGYRVVDVTDMSGPAAAAIEQADGPGVVVVLALASDDKTITISPVGLGITEDSPEFTLLESMLERIATRS